MHRIKQQALIMRFPIKALQRRLPQLPDAKRRGFVANKAPSIVRRAMVFATVISTDTKRYPSNGRKSRWIFFRKRDWPRRFTSREQRAARGLIHRGRINVHKL